MLTELSITKMAAPDKRREVPDGKVSGLYLIVQPSGAKSWALRYRLGGGGKKKLTIGPYPAITLAEARRRAQEALGAIAAGKDPAADKKAQREAEKAASADQADRVERVVEQFIARHAKPKTRDWRETQRMLQKEVVSRWGGRRLSDITRANVRDLLDEMRERGAPVGANRVFAQFRKLCNWAIGRDLIATSPCAGHFELTKENKRERVLSDDELRIVWRAFDAVGWPFGHIGKLLLLTGARREEVAGMTWREVDAERRLWSLPPERSKNGRAHDVPLSATALEILAWLPRIKGSGGFVFTTTGSTSVTGFSRAKRAVDRAIQEAIDMPESGEGHDPSADAAKALSAHPNGAGEPFDEHWVIHDLRRTVATNLQKLGVRLEVTEAVLGHVSGSRAGVVGIYQRHGWADEKRAALEAWARSLDAIVSGEPASNVIELARARS